MRRRDSRVLGPYRDGDRWRIVVIEGGRRAARKVASEAEALRLKRELDRELVKTQALTTSEALDRYEQHMLGKGNKPASVAGTIGKLRNALASVDDLAQITPRKAAQLYQRLCTRPSARTGRPLSVDSHRNLLAECKTFGRWAARCKLLPADPFAAIEGVGRRRTGKPQLRIDEARQWCRKALELAEAGDAGAVAALVSLLLALRASEICSIVVRDIDDDGRILWIPDSKTAAGRRQLEIPAALRPHFRELCTGKRPTDRIFGEHWRDWPRKQVLRICKLAKVPEVCAHSMRGLHSTLALSAGASSHVVAASLGHENPAVTLRHYAQRGTAEAQRSAQAQARLADVIPLRAHSAQG